MKLNGWRRGGVLLSIFWFAGIASWAAIEFSKPPRGGVFVYFTLSDDYFKGVEEEVQITHPNGEVTTEVVLWDHNPNAPKEKRVKWLRFAVVSLGLPFSFWIVLELFTFGIRWVMRGFQENA